MKRTRVVRFATMPNHKMFYDAPTAREFIHGQGDNHSMRNFLHLPMLIFVLLWPWRYEIGDWKDRCELSDADRKAFEGYRRFIGETQTQRNRAWLQFIIWNNPAIRTMQPTRMAGGMYRNYVTTQGGWQAWDQETGRPIHNMEAHNHLSHFAANPMVEKRYIEETRNDMDRIRAIRDELVEIRKEMQGEKTEMYKKTMQ